MGNLDAWAQDKGLCQYYNDLPTNIFAPPSLHPESNDPNITYGRRQAAEPSGFAELPQHENAAAWPEDSVLCQYYAGLPTDTFSQAATDQAISPAQSSSPLRDDSASNTTTPFHATTQEDEKEDPAEQLTAPQSRIYKGNDPAKKACNLLRIAAETDAKTRKLPKPEYHNFFPRNVFICDNPPHPNDWADIFCTTHTTKAIVWMCKKAYGAKRLSLGNNKKYCPEKNCRFAVTFCCNCHFFSQESLPLDQHPTCPNRSCISYNLVICQVLLKDNQSICNTPMRIRQVSNGRDTYWTMRCTNSSGHAPVRSKKSSD